MSIFKPIVFSAVQPSGNLTLGNYIGSISHWSSIQRTHNCLYSIADLHSMTVFQDACILRNYKLDTLSFYLASGVNPEKSVIFMQSDVTQHCQLYWILSCYTYFGELSRMTQFKHKSKIYNNNINIGLFSYPILMASDILLYKSNKVLVGDDQKQHLELASNIAKRFNVIYKNFFAIPRIYIPNKHSANIMALLNPKIKMSKSDRNLNNVIFLLDNEKFIFKKIYRSITDSENKIKYDINNKMGISNLINIYASLTGKNILMVEKIFKNILYKDFKYLVAKRITNSLFKLQEKFYFFRKNESYLTDILYDGAKKAKKKAKKTIQDIYNILGLH